MPSLGGEGRLQVEGGAVVSGDEGVRPSGGSPAVGDMSRAQS